jgi:hypothetical protein
MLLLNDVSIIATSIFAECPSTEQKISTGEALYSASLCLSYLLDSLNGVL